MLLIHPPIAKACEPPAGLAILAGVLRAHGHSCQVMDCNLEAQELLIQGPAMADDTWTRRAKKHASNNLEAIRQTALYQTFSRYQRCVADLNRALNQSSRQATMTLSNYTDNSFSCVRSEDLLAAAEHPELSPFHDYFVARLTQVLAERSPRFVGFSLNFMSQAVPTFAMIGTLKKIAPHLPIMVGGGLITSWMRHPNWNNPFSGCIDHCIDGPGEAALLELLGPRPQQNLNAPPDYSVLPLDRYWSPSPVLPLAASRGCYWNRCTFCPERAEQNPYQPLAVSRVVDQLHHLCNAWQPGLVHLLDNAISPAVINALMAQPLPAPWYGFARISEHLADPDYCRALRHSGCVMIKLGVESGDNQVLESMDKGVSVDLTERVLTCLKQAGIATYIYLLFGTPKEDLDAAEKTREFIRRNHQAIGFLNLAIFNLPTNSPDAQHLDLHPFYQGDLSLYSDFDHPKGWNRGEVRRFIDKRIKKEPLIAEILRRDPPQFTSNHAAFFV
nr:radical SAM protein [uncultured Desulfuromonas sp.]